MLTAFIALSGIGALLLVCFVTKLCRDGNRRRTSSNHSSVHKVRS